MLDIKLIRERPDEVKRSLATVGTPPEMIDAVLEADARRRKLITEAEQMRATRAATSKTVGKLPPDERERVVAEMRALGDRIAEAEQQVAAAEDAFTAALMELPNLPHPDVPVGPDESANRLVREVGTAPAFAFTPQPHWDLGPALGIIDFERGVKISGSRFYVLRARRRAAARADHVDARPARRASTATRGLPAGDGAHRVPRRHRATPEVRRHDVSRHRGGLWFVRPPRCR
jgi:seryl-tRNA synthetase